MDESKIQAYQAKSLKKAIKETIKEHTKEHKVQKVMLDELIQLYVNLELMDEDEISYLRGGFSQIEMEYIHFNIGR